MFRVEQRLEGPQVDDVAGTIRQGVRRLDLRARTRPGQSIAITAGSRGITGIDGVIRTVVEECRLAGLEPFIIPAMGSHGGATGDGQRRVLEHYGITEITMGCPVVASMETVRIGDTGGIPVFCDRNAWEADHIAVVARVKPHTDFDNEIESGLFKMMAVGLGKRDGAEHYHRAGRDYGYGKVFPAVGKKVLETAKVLFGLAIVENGYGATARLEAIPPEDFYETEKALLRQAKAWLGKLPFAALDLLIVDEMGKNISGAGLDPNVVGRPCNQKPAGKPVVRQLLVRDLTSESDGNAIGIGMADMITRRLAGKISPVTTNTNTITTGALDLARVPMAFDSDWAAIETALGMIGLTAPQDARVVRIKNTLHLTAMDVSMPLGGEVDTNPRLSRLTSPGALVFDDEGNLPSF
jgi:hypothetical protein